MASRYNNAVQTIDSGWSELTEANVRKRWRQFWHVTVLTLAAVAVVVVHVVVSCRTREPMNYTEIEDGLWIGGYVLEPPPGTQAVLNLCESDDPYRVESHRWQPIRDAEPAPSLDWLEEQVQFIESERAEGRVVFVHCRNGVSRSGMVVVAYFMRREGWTRDQTLKFLRTLRPELRPHPGFMLLLLEWQQFLKR